ncbi:hypothetical protein KV572_02040 [Pseudomonas yamanorum]|uniref:helix-turn-helix domain-containing protein n=1 Tax=Pseudomonas yamanorum TaxID=515393 RepID=UPI001C48C23A|nr:hypothetical protein [Pseudomonas yamanorum]
METDWGERYGIRWSLGIRSPHRNVSLAAEQLGASRSTLQRRIRANQTLLHTRDRRVGSC